MSTQPGSCGYVAPRRVDAPHRRRWAKQIEEEMKLDNTRSRVVSLQQGMLMCAVATVLCLAPQTHAQVSYTNLHVFTGGTEGSAPVGLMVDGGTLYGTTINGGVSDAGIVFSLSTSGTAFTVLHRFNGVDSANPYGS